jgi:hypothetical protein
VHIHICVHIRTFRGIDVNNDIDVSIDIDIDIGRDIHTCINT